MNRSMQFTQVYRGEVVYSKNIGALVLSIHKVYSDPEQLSMVGWQSVIYFYEQERRPTCVYPTFDTAYVAGTQLLNDESKQFNYGV